MPLCFLVPKFMCCVLYGDLHIHETYLTSVDPISSLILVVVGARSTVIVNMIKIYSGIYLKCKGERLVQNAQKHTVLSHNLARLGFPSLFNFNKRNLFHGTTLLNG